MNTTDPVTSPFDPYLSTLLAWGMGQPNGFSHPAIIHAMVNERAWQAAFAEAVFNSARVRGLIGPHYGTRARGRVYWIVSRKGDAWLQARTQTNDSSTGTPSPDSGGGAAAESTNSG